MPGEKILVIDDAKNIREIFSSAFEEYDIVTASSGQEALGILKKPNDIDLIILDVMMPDINGLELLKEIRKVNTSCRVAIMTGYSSKDIAIEALRLDADEYIEKPFDIEEVRGLLRRLLGKNSGLSAGGLSESSGKIRLAQRLIKRTYNKPFSLNDISKEVFLSYKYLSRVFKEKTGESFSECRIRLKLTCAKHLLRKGNYSVSQIAYKLGYQNPESFMKIFKKSTGLTPSQYRDGKTGKGK